MVKLNAFKERNTPVVHEESITMLSPEWQSTKRGEAYLLHLHREMLQLDAFTRKGRGAPNGYKIYSMLQIIVLDIKYPRGGSLIPTKGATSTVW